MVKRILVLDDHEEILQLIEEALSYNEKFEVMTTSNDNEIVKTALNYKPHLIILDYKLSGSRGDDICRLIKADNVLFNTPVIMCSAYLNKNDLLTCGCDAILPKPFGLEELLMKVNNLVFA